MPAAPQQQCYGGCELRKFDQVNRLAIPAKFRSRYGSTVYLLKNFLGDKCIIMYSEEAYLKVYNNIANDYSGAELAIVQRLFTQSSDMATMDKAGRITVSEEFQEFAELKGEALIVNSPDRIELWNKDNLDRKLEAAKSIDLTKFNISPGIL